MELMMLNNFSKSLVVGLLSIFSINSYASFPSLSSTSESMVSIVYKSPQGQQNKAAHALIIDNQINATFEALINEHFPFDKKLNVIYGGDDGPLYDPNNHSIYIPYNFIVETKRYFSKNKAENIEKGVIDTLIHTLLHEAGHALVEDQSIPILGKEEDAVDNLATIIMLRYLESGSDAAINAADMFDFESDSGEEYYAFSEYIDEHSFDLQRYFSTLCLVYGSDPKLNQNLLDEVEDEYLADKKEACEVQYQQLQQNWDIYLHNKSDA